MSTLSLMGTKIISTFSALALVGSLVVMPTPSYAGSKRGIVGFGVGVIVGIGLAKGFKKSRKRRRIKRRTVRRSANRSNKFVAYGATNQSDMFQIQSALANLGYYTKRIDGIGGRGTRRAISGFQRDKGFAATGRLTGNQKAMLMSAAGIGIGVVGVQGTGYASSTGQNGVAGSSTGEVNIFGNSNNTQPTAAQPPTFAPQGGGEFGATAAKPQSGDGTSGTRIFDAQPSVPAPKRLPSPDVDQSELANVFDEPSQPVGAGSVSPTMENTANAQLELELE